ncbi:Serpin B7 [Thelohanellus kitauei]|uniref:Serpin B7 n=1 Tax=Thelohanellus kitauei TaxID=669202 RepID=A0A0C2M5J1_THEKT|nr:Serpin B7 [Thelohanellus kitauei]
MSLEGVNGLTATLLNQIFDSQNATGNIALSGIGLYLLLGTINVGLGGKSYHQLWKFWEENFEEMYTETWRYSNTGQKWLYLQKLSRELSMQASALFYSSDLHYLYDQISEYLFNLHKVKIDFTNPSESDAILNEFVTHWTYGEIEHVFEGSMQSVNKMVFIHTLFYRADWIMNFDSALTKREMFYGDSGKPFMVSMMNQESLNKIFDQPGYNFRILFKDLNHISIVSAIVLPRDRHGVKNVLNNFKVFKIFIQFYDMYTYFEKSKSMNVKLKLPKFKILRHDDLVDTLKKFGIIDIFDPEVSDFGMMTNYSVFIGNLMQVVNLGIDDMDLAATHTTEPLKEQSVSATCEFKVNRPFLFYIYSYLAEVALFSAVVTHPDPV